MTAPLLDVVIPACRRRFLGETLESLAVQEDRAFRVIVGDDASPEDLATVCESFRDRLDLVYHRFPENLGATDLVAQWNRCVRLGSSPWVWLFSDDDVASPGCVGALRSALAAGAAVARLDLRVIDARGDVIDMPPDPPESESREHFLWQRFKRRRESFAVEYAFGRDRWENAGGFVPLPSAWCSDDASWWSLSGDDGIRHAPGGVVGWRWSGTNITASHRRDPDKLEACVRFLELVGSEGIRGMEEALGLAEGSGSMAAYEWFRFHLDGLRVKSTARSAREIESRLVAVLGSVAEGAGRQLLRKNWRLLADRLRGRIGSAP